MLSVALALVDLTEPLLLGFFSALTVSLEAFFLWKKGAVYRKRAKKTIEALGIKKLHKPVIHNDSIEIRGMINSVKHLLIVEDVS